MNTFSRTIPFIAAAASLLLGSNASATAWGDSSQSSSELSISSVDSSVPTVLRTVTVKCPKAGRLMAYAGAAFTVFPASPIGGWINFSITKTTAFDDANYSFAGDSKTDGYKIVPSAMQRADSCTAGQTVTYRFVAYRNGAHESSYAIQPRLNVTFVDTII